MIEFSEQGDFVEVVPDYTIEAGGTITTGFQDITTTSSTEAPELLKPIIEAGHPTFRVRGRVEIVTDGLQHDHYAVVEDGAERVISQGRGTVNVEGDVALAEGYNDGKVVVHGDVTKAYARSGPEVSALNITVKGRADEVRTVSGGRVIVEHDARDVVSEGPRSLVYVYGDVEYGTSIDGGRIVAFDVRNPTFINSEPNAIKRTGYSSL